MSANSPPSSETSVSTASSLLHASIQRLASQSATCKLWSVVLASVVLLFAAGRVGAEALLWAAAPVLLLALADAGYAARARSLSEAFLSPTKKGEDSLLAAFAPVRAADALKGMAAVSVWPFYLGLVAIVGGLGMMVIVPKPKTPSLTAPVPPSAQFGQVMPQTGQPVLVPPPTPATPAASVSKARTPASSSQPVRPPTLIPPPSSPQGTPQRPPGLPAPDGAARTPDADKAK